MARKVILKRAITSGDGKYYYREGEIVTLLEKSKDTSYCIVRMKDNREMCVDGYTDIEEIEQNGIKNIDKLRKELAKRLEEDILNRYYGWEYFDKEIIDSFIYDLLRNKNTALTEEEKETLLRPLKNLF